MKDQIRLRQLYLQIGYIILLRKFNEWSKLTSHENHCYQTKSRFAPSYHILNKLYQ